jgi:hypothetical protein
MGCARKADFAGALQTHRATAQGFDFSGDVCYYGFAHIVAYIAKQLPHFLLDGVAEAWRRVTGDDMDRRPFARRPPG